MTNADTINGIGMIESLEATHMESGFDLLLKLFEKHKVNLTGTQLAQVATAFQQGFRFGVAKALQYVRHTPPQPSGN